LEQSLLTLPILEVLVNIGKKWPIFLRLDARSSVGPRTSLMCRSSSAVMGTTCSGWGSAGVRAFQALEEGGTAWGGGGGGGQGFLGGPICGTDDMGASLAGELTATKTSSSVDQALYSSGCTQCRDVGTQCAKCFQSRSPLPFTPHVHHRTARWVLFVKKMGLFGTVEQQCTCSCSSPAELLRGSARTQCTTCYA